MLSKSDYIINIAKDEKIPNYRIVKDVFLNTIIYEI